MIIGCSTTLQNINSWRPRLVGNLYLFCFSFSISFSFSFSFSLSSLFFYFFLSLILFFYLQLLWWISLLLFGERCTRLLSETERVFLLWGSDVQLYTSRQHLDSRPDSFVWKYHCHHMANQRQKKWKGEIFSFEYCKLMHLLSYDITYTIAYK